jgi:hypothetical protein
MAAERPPAGRRLVNAALTTRVLIAALAVVAAVVGIQALRHQDRCNGAIVQLYSVLPATSRAQAVRDMHRVVDVCPADRTTIGALFNLIAAGHTDVALQAGEALTRRTPDDYQGWLLEAFAATNRNPRLFRLSVEKVRVLRPTIEP